MLLIASTRGYCLIQACQDFYRATQLSNELLKTLGLCGAVFKASSSSLKMSGLLIPTLFKFQNDYNTFKNTLQASKWFTTLSSFLLPFFSPATTPSKFMRTTYKTDLTSPQPWVCHFATLVHFYQIIGLHRLTESGHTWTASKICSELTSHSFYYDKTQFSL